jgi:hypothetical protein
MAMQLTQTLPPTLTLTELTKNPKRKDFRKPIGRFALEVCIVQNWISSFKLDFNQDKHVTQNKNNKIYACFVDFKKAFDSVWHEGLYSKLLKYKIGGNFYRLIN